MTVEGEAVTGGEATTDAERPLRALLGQRIGEALGAHWALAADDQRHLGAHGVVTIGVPQADICASASGPLEP